MYKIHNTVQNLFKFFEAYELVLVFLVCFIYSHPLNIWSLPCILYFFSINAKKKLFFIEKLQLFLLVSFSCDISGNVTVGKNEI